MHEMLQQISGGLASIRICHDKLLLVPIGYNVLLVSPQYTQNP